MSALAASTLGAMSDLSEAAVRRPPRLAPRGIFYGWVVVAVSVLAVLVTAGGRAAPGALLVDMERSTDWSTTSLSVAASIGLFVYGFSGPVAAALNARFGLRAVTTFALVASAVSFAASARA